MHVREMYNKISEIGKKLDVASSRFIKFFLDSVKTHFPHMYRNTLYYLIVINDFC